MVNGMILLNFSHPLTDDQTSKIEELSGQTLREEQQIAVEINNELPLMAQIIQIVDKVILESREWQTHPLLINLPGYAPAAACLLAEIHGRSGHFPAIIKIRPVPNSLPTTYEVAELIDLQSARQESRRRR